MVTVTISSEQVGLNRIDLPEFAGKDIIVYRRPIGILSSDEFNNLSSGGFELLDRDDDNNPVAIGTGQTDGFELGEKFFVSEKAAGIAEASIINYSAGAVRQYPHVMQVGTVNEAEVDADGNWQSESSGDPDAYQCRAESNSSNGFLTRPDGQHIDFSWIVYMPLMDVRLQEGSQVTIYDGEDIILIDTVKRFSKGQLNCRVWL